jgi:phosphoesterase RecJ-like protein
VDTSVENRLGPAFMDWKRKVDLNIDHHVSNTNYGILNFIDPSLPASAALILKIIKEANLPLSPSAASNLFVGLSTDTGSFRYRGTTAETFQAAADLVRAGADSAELSRLCYQSVTPQKFDLIRFSLQSIRFEKERRLGIMELTPEMFRNSGASNQDTEGLIDFLQDIQTVELAVLFEERDSENLKVSLRSKGTVNVSLLASEFGGGGHPSAAGINLKGPVRELQNKILDRLREAL